MNLILLSNDDFIEPNGVRLSGRRYKHITDVLRSKVGDELNVGIINGKIGQGRVMALKDKAVELEIACDQEPPEALPLTLMLALPRPIIVPRIISAVTAMGVKRIILFHCDRVQKSFWLSPVLKEDKLREAAILGLEQARDTILPEILIRKRFKPFVEDEIPKFIRGSKAFVAHPDFETSQPCPSIQGAVTLMIGPEGGFIPYEIEKLKTSGFTAIYLGKRILRVETAVTALITKLSL